MPHILLFRRRNSHNEGEEAIWLSEATDYHAEDSRFTNEELEQACEEDGWDLVHVAEVDDDLSGWPTERMIVLR